jgi:class 3 adenylate cyclase
MSETRKLAAIVVADVVGYSRLAGTDEDRTLARLRGLRSDLIDPAIAAHHGRIIKRTGDGSIIEFRSVVDAVRCALEVQTGMVERNAGLAPERRIEFPIGIHLGDVVEEADGDLMGDGVNVAARLEGICEPGQICLSEDAHRQVKSRLELQVADLGPQFDMCALQGNLAHDEQAVEWCNKAAAGLPQVFLPYVPLASANAWAGHDKEAKDAVAQLLKVYPGFTVQTWAGMYRSDDPTFNARIQRFNEGEKKTD